MIIKTDSTVHLNMPTPATLYHFALVDDGKVVYEFAGASIVSIDGTAVVKDSDGFVNCIIWGKPGQWLQVVGQENK